MEMKTDVIETTETIEISRARRISRILLWGGLGLASLIFFTIVKFPEEKAKAYILGSVNQALSQQGMSLQADETDLSILFGTVFSMENARLILPPPAPAVPFDLIEVRPALLPALLGRISAKAFVEKDDSEIDAAFSTDGSKTDLSFDLDDVDLNKLGLIHAMTQIRILGKLNGDGDLGADFRNPTTLDGQVHLKFADLRLPAQALMGFALPEIKIGKAEIKLAASGGKVFLRTFELGEVGGKTGDLGLKLTGSARLGNQWRATNLDVEARLSVSDKIRQALFFIDGFLGAGKKPDGSYAFKLSGPVMSPIPTPVK